MNALGPLNAEFEALGEAGVSERLSANIYTGEARALAMRWLNDKVLARASVEASVHAVVTDASTRRIIRAEQGARAAILCAVAALLAAIGSLGLSLQTLRTVQDLRHAEASAQARPTSTTSAPARSASTPSAPAS
jgi:hypothetical protein